MYYLMLRHLGFNTQPPEGGWESVVKSFFVNRLVSTHSRPKAAGAEQTLSLFSLDVSTHSRPKAAGNLLTVQRNYTQSFNTQPPEGGWAKEDGILASIIEVSTHSRPKAAGI